MSVNLKGLRPVQAAEKLGIGVSTLWARAKREADFPKPVKLSMRTTIFVEHELDAYLQKRIAEARGAVLA
ncbi:MAG: AlpA family phage regulatory protein [Paraburkholderia sp.]|uniref:helix-turn-helix transcriptional regulator n=1 Tax=Paraburkholderia sp. TaxID=1926495 RepID=UPI0012044AE0|nr:AlpA family phage regulatory protein [Paraburkholderia sp.]TAM08289.1 MAG: AlpA family phage regulatory protein [Paraburkholderia sp.]TAM28057.1 MAG: AlpA family phage regulatory protein [Paraburkholderia sp.]